MTRALATLTLAILVSLPGTARTQELGRLFLTPEQRATLDARRKARVPDKPGAAAVSPVTRIDGFVQRSGGRSTVWVNGEAVTEGAARGTVRINRGRPGEVGITTPLGEESRDARARVGQTVDTATGEIRDPLGDGEIRVRRPADKAGTRR